MKKIILLIGYLAITISCNIGASSTIRESPTATALPPISIAAATTPASPPTLTATQTPLPLYFTEEFDTTSISWTFLQTGGTGAPTSSFENGSLRIIIPLSDTWYIGIYKANTYLNSLTTAKSSATPAGSIGLICRYDESKGWIEFNVASDGTYSVLFGKWLVPGIAQYTPIATDSARLLTAGNLNYEIGLSCQDNSLLLYINGTLLRRLDIERFELTEGNIGITTSTFQESPMTALFEWIRVDEK